MDRTFRPPRPLRALRAPGRRGLARLLLAPALVAGLLAGGAWDAPAAHALGPGDPPRCDAFVKRYFQSGLPDGSFLSGLPELGGALGLTTESITGEATYAETRGLEDWVLLKTVGAPFSTTKLTGTATEYVSTRRTPGSG